MAIDIGAPAKVGDVRISAVITRADGTVEDLGQIVGQYDDPIQRAWWKYVGHPLSERRIRAANKSAERKR